MKKVFVSFVNLFLTLVLINQRVAAQTAPVSGFIVDIRDGVFLKIGSQKVKLDRKKDLRRALHHGEELSCDPTGWVRITLCNQADAGYCKYHDVNPNSTFRITPNYPPRSEYERNREEAMQELGRIDGVDLEALSPVYSPSSQSVVRPSTLKVRWVKSEALSSLSLIVKDTGGQVIWHEKVSNGGTGELDSQSLRSALLSYRSEIGVGPLILEIEDKNQKGSQLRFSLISQAKETALASELAEWDREQDLFVRHLGRANAFYSYSMFEDVAEEFEAALAETPDSRELIQRTIQAHKTTGNTTRADELKRRLAGE